MKNKYQVDIRMNSSVERGGEIEEEAAERLQGEFFLKQGTYYLRYKENMESIGRVMNTIKINENEAMILRNGPVSMRQPLVEGRVTEGYYDNPYGRLETLAKATDCSVIWHEEKGTGTLELHYHLEMQGETLGIFHLVFNLREVN